ncbi:ABC transporter ATP-binding protein [Planctomycetota bacterium]
MKITKQVKVLLTKKERYAFVAFVFVTIFISVVEVCSLGLLAKFIAVSLGHDDLTKEYLSNIVKWYRFDNPVPLFGLCVVLFFVFRTVINLQYYKQLNKLIWAVNNRLNVQLIKKFLYLPYIEYVNEKSSDLSKKVQIEASNATLFINQLMVTLCETIVVVFISLYMIATSIQLFCLLGALLVVYFVAMRSSVFKKMSEQGEKRSTYQGNIFKSIVEFFGNFKFYKLLGDYESTVHQFKKESRLYTDNRALAATLSIQPTFLLQFLIYSFIVVVILVTSKIYDDKNYLNVLAVFAVSLYRIAPSIGKIITGVSQMLYYKVSLTAVLNDLNRTTEHLGQDKIAFRKNIRLENVRFGYANQIVLDGLFGSIERGSKVGFIGESGSGKSTLVDVICGLHFPESGTVCVDGVVLDSQNVLSWRTKIGYIPQQIYLLDGSVKENIVLQNKYDEIKLEKVLRQANILNFLKTKDGIDTVVGENGVKLSGGQKQRIGIARALYNDPEILVLDEATSALDSETEARIMEEIYNLSDTITVIVVAHRLNTLKKCDKICKLEHGKISSESIKEVLCSIP